MTRALSILCAVLFAWACSGEVELVRPPVTEVLEQNPPTQVDILLVIDDSCSMADELERLRSQDELSGEYLEHQDYPRRVSVADFELALDELAADCDARGAQLVLVAMPRRLGVEERYWPLPEYDAALERSPRRARPSRPSGAWARARTSCSRTPSTRPRVGRP